MQIGPYRVLDELARGGQGVVYRAKDTRIGRTVVLKLLQADVEAHARRLLREAKAMAQLRHPHLVPLHEVGEHDGKPYLVLPYVTGESLQDQLDKSGPLRLDTALRLADQVAQALEAAHDAGLVHRDVKPANVLLDEHGRALLTDFGLVKKVGPGQSATLSLSVQGRFLGTPGYWPPEQARGKHDAIGPPADVYAWGGLLYALLSGRPPRDAPNLRAALLSFEKPVEPLTTFRQDVPPWLERLVLACLVDDPRERPTLAVARAALENQAFRGPVSSRARLAWATAAAVVACALAVWSTVATLQRIPSREELSSSAREPAEERGYWEPRAAGEGGGPTVVTQATCVLDAPTAHASAVTAMAYDPVSDRILTGSADGDLLLTAASSGEVLARWNIATSRDETLTRRRPGIQVGSDPILGVGFGPEGQSYAHASTALYSLGKAGSIATKWLWASSSGCFAVHPELGAVVGLDRGLSGYVVRGEAGRLSRVAELELGNQWLDLVRFSPSGDGLALGLGTAWRWSPSGWQPSELTDFDVVDLAWNPAGDRLVTINKARELRLYRWPEGLRVAQKRLGRPESETATLGVCFSSDGERVYTTGSSDEAWVWDATDLRPLYRRLAPPISSAGRIVQIIRGPPGTLLVRQAESPQVMLIDEKSTEPLWSTGALPRTRADVTRSMGWQSDHTLLLDTALGAGALNLQRGELVLPRDLRLASPGERFLVHGARLWTQSQDRLEVGTPAPEAGALALAEHAGWDLDSAHEVFGLAASPNTTEVSLLVRRQKGWSLDTYAYPDSVRSKPLPALGGSRDPAYLARALPGDARVFVVSGSSLHVVGPRDVETHALGGPARHLVQVSPSSVCYVLDRKLAVLELESSTRRSVRSLGDLEPLDLLPLTGGQQLAVATPATVVLFELDYFTARTELVLPHEESLAGLCESPAADAIYVWTRRGTVYRFMLLE